MSDYEIYKNLTESFLDKEEELDYEEDWEDNSEEYRLRDFEDKVDYYYDYFKEQPQLEWADKQ